MTRSAVWFTIAALATWLWVGSCVAAPKPPRPPTPPCIGGCPRASKAELPAPDVSGKSPDTVLSLMRWIASLRDFSDAKKFLGTLHQSFTPDFEYAEVEGQQRLNFTHYLDGKPLAEESPIDISYTVTDPAGYAAKFSGRSLSRGDVTLGFDTDRLCINKTWMEHHFGGPYAVNVVTDGGGASWTWDIGVWRRRHVYANAYFGPHDDRCAERIYFSQTDRPI